MSGFRDWLIYGKSRPKPLAAAAPIGTQAVQTVATRLLPDALEMWQQQGIAGSGDLDNRSGPMRIACVNRGHDRCP